MKLILDTIRRHLRATVPEDGGHAWQVHALCVMNFLPFEEVRASRLRRKKTIVRIAKKNLQRGPKWGKGQGQGYVADALAY